MLLVFCRHPKSVQSKQGPGAGRRTLPHRPRSRSLGGLIRQTRARDDLIPHKQDEPGNHADHRPERPLPHAACPPHLPAALAVAGSGRWGESMPWHQKAGAQAQLFLSLPVALGQVI